MLYKEWRSARQKYFLVLLGYVLVGLLVSTLLGPKMAFPSGSIFHNWVQWTLFVTIGAAILGGSDSIAEENGKNTLSFLLTRPVSRTTIFALKFLVSAACLSLIIAATSLVMFVVEQLPQNYKSGYMVWENDVPRMIETTITVEKMSGGEAFTCMAVVLGIGLVGLAFTTLVSIFSRSALNTIVATILIALGLVTLYAIIDAYFFNMSPRLKGYFDIYRGLGFGDFFVLAGLAAGVYFIGLKIFKAKEF